MYSTSAATRSGSSVWSSTIRWYCRTSASPSASAWTCLPLIDPVHGALVVFVGRSRKVDLSFHNFFLEVPRAQHLG